MRTAILPTVVVVAVRQWSIRSMNSVVEAIVGTIVLRSWLWCTNLLVSLTHLLCLLVMFYETGDMNMNNMFETLL